MRSSRLEVEDDPAALSKWDNSHRYASQLSAQMHELVNPFERVRFSSIEQFSYYCNWQYLNGWKQARPMKWSDRARFIKYHHLKTSQKGGSYSSSIRELIDRVDFSRHYQSALAYVVEGADPEPSETDPYWIDRTQSQTQSSSSSIPTRSHPQFTAWADNRYSADDWYQWKLWYY